MARKSVKENLFRHFKYIVVGGLFIILVVVLVLFLVLKGDSKDEEADSSAEISTNIEVPKDKYEEDKFPEVNTLLINYFDAMSRGDVDTIDSLSNTLTDEERIRIQVQSKYYNGFSNYKVYTKQGPVPNSYFAFVTYDILFTGSDTPAPALSSVYVCTDDTGALYVNKEDPSDDEKAYFQALAVQEDVSELCEQVEIDYNKALDEDDSLSSLMTSIKDQINQEVKETLSAKQQEEAEAQAAAEAEAMAQEAQASAVTVKATDTVNIRASASTEAEALGKAEVGQQFTRYEKMDNGWSRVDYNGQEAFINSDYLQEVETSSNESELPVGDGAKMVTVKENVRVRSSASKENNDNVLGTAYRGLQLELISKDGEWCKVKYNGQDAYVSSDYVE